MEEGLIIDYIQSVLIHYGEYLGEPYKKDILEGDIHFGPRNLSYYSNKHTKKVLFSHEPSSKGHGSKSDLGGDMYGYEIFTIKNGFITKNTTSKFTLWHDT
ncbi:1394_t:CDS:2 [Entrophospora sp. SA101]|nr:1394_t:CDS:2 [Entrophospora sp. SA101]